MPASRWPRILVIASSVLLLQAGIPASLLAQAWVPAKGEGNLTLSYQNSFVRNHLDETGARLDLGHTRSSGIIQDWEYGLTDRMAVNISLPYIFSKYMGDDPEGLPTDDGKYHSTFQDFRVGLRYNLRMRPLVLTPFVEVVIPSHHYQFFGHSAVGSDLHEFRVGINAGRRLDPILPRAYFQTRYHLAVADSTQGTRPFRERLESEFGYLVTKRVTLSGVEALQLTHHGLNFPDITDENVDIHDKLLNIDLLNVGGGFSVAMTDSVTVFGYALTSVWGRNAHALHQGLVFGINYNFRTHRYRRRASASEACGTLPRNCERPVQESHSVSPVLSSSLGAGR